MWGAKTSIRGRQNVRCEDLTATLVKIVVFRGVTLCILGYTAMITCENTLFLKGKCGNLYDRFY